MLVASLAVINAGFGVDRVAAATCCSVCENNYFTCSSGCGCGPESEVCQRVCDRAYNLCSNSCNPAC
jgi:hypothetical protein